MWPATVPTDLPIMIISGAKDPVGSNGKGPIACSDSLIEAGHEPTVVIYPGVRHEILNEDCKEKVYNDILGWTQSILQGEYIAK